MLIIISYLYFTKYVKDTSKKGYGGEQAKGQNRPEMGKQLHLIYQRKSSKSKQIKHTILNPSTPSRQRNLSEIFILKYTLHHY